VLDRLSRVILRAWPNPGHGRAVRRTPTCLGCRGKVLLRPSALSPYPMRPLARSGDAMSYARSRRPSRRHASRS